MYVNLVALGDSIDSGLSNDKDMCASVPAPIPGNARGGGTTTPDSADGDTDSGPVVFATILDIRESPEWCDSLRGATKDDNDGATEAASISVGAYDDPWIAAVPQFENLGEPRRHEGKLISTIGAGDGCLVSA